MLSELLGGGRIIKKKILFCVIDAVFKMPAFNRPEASNQPLSGRDVLVHSPPGSRPSVQSAAISLDTRQHPRGPFYRGSFLRRLPRHGTYHDSKPLPSLPGFVYRDARFSSDH